MIRKLIGAVALAAMAAMLTGCIALGGVDREASTIDKSVGAARNSSILLNIVRASRGEPLYFYTINQVQGAGMEDFKVSLPPVTFGPRQTAAQQNYTFGTNGLNVLDSQKSGFFNVGVLDSKNFYAGMLQPLDLVAVDVLIKQGFPRELIYRLAVADITFYGLNPATGKVGLYRFNNDPTSPDYKYFNMFLSAAMSHGITTEEYYMTGGHAAGGDKSDAGGKPDPGGQGAEKGGSDETTAARLCADLALVDDQAALDDISKSHNACGERPQVQAAEVSGPQSVIGLPEAWKACSDSKALSSGGDHPTNQVCSMLQGQYYAIQLDTRSLFGIFRYLGAVMASGSDVELLGQGSPNETKTAGRLMTVAKDQQSDCFTSTDWHGHYCIPGAGSDNLKQAFSIINALQALKTSPGDLPFTPTVRIQQ